MRPADRLFQIVLLLGRGRVLTARLLADRLEVSERTIYRDIQDLMVSGVPIEGEAGVGYCLRRGYQIPPLMFDEQELQALVFGADVAKSWGDVRMSESTTKMLGDVRDAINSRMRVFVEYHDVGGETTERIVWPLTLAYWGMSWTLGAWCELRQDFRNFRVDRISSARGLRSTFPDEPGKRLEDYFASSACSSTRNGRAPQEIRQ